MAPRFGKRSYGLQIGSRSRLWFAEQNVAQLSKLLAWITVDSFSGNTGTTGAFHPSARFRFGESSDNDRQRLRKS